MVAFLSIVHDYCVLQETLLFTAGLQMFSSLRHELRVLGGSVLEMLGSVENRRRQRFN